MNTSSSNNAFSKQNSQCAYEILLGAAYVYIEVMISCKRYVPVSHNEYDGLCMYSNIGIYYS